MQPAYEKIGVVDAQWIRHKVVPSLGEQVRTHLLFDDSSCFSFLLAGLKRDITLV